MRHIYLVFAALLLVANTSCAASFDCEKATTKVEKMICADAELSKLDETLGRGYALALTDKKLVVSTKESQRQWLKERNLCEDESCLRKQYMQRIDAMDEVVRRGGFLAAGGRYRMIDANFSYPNGEPRVEKYAEVCTAFLRNLDALAPDPPMACDVKIAPGMTDFKAPEWRDIDVWENRDLALQIMYADAPANEVEKEKRLANIRAYIDADRLFFQIAEFDIDNDGIKDHVLANVNRKFNGDTGIYNGLKCRSYLTFNPATQRINNKKRAFYSSYWGNPAAIQLSHSAFLYKGDTYIARFSSGGMQLEADYPEKSKPNKSYVELFRPNPMGPHQPVALGCKYVYLPKSGEGN